MKRLVYSPSMKVWVKSDSGVIDLSPYLVNCQVSRKVNDVSTAEIEFRNPKVMQDGKPRFMFTEHSTDGKILPLFHPMDPITITFERIAGRPIQVFTGYCDSTPDVQLFPGTAKITASCTLKRLKYTYWDAALPFVNDFMKNYGWLLDKKTGQVTGRVDDNAAKNTISSTNNLNDSSIAGLLYAVLNEIGGWDPSNIFIQPLPGNIISIVTKLFDEITKDNKAVNNEVAKLLSTIIGHGSFGTSVASGGTGGSVSTGPTNSSGGAPGWVEQLIQDASRKYGVDANLIREQMRAESGFDPNAKGAPGIVGLMQVSQQYVQEQTGFTANEVTTDN